LIGIVLGKDPSLAKTFLNKHVCSSDHGSYGSGDTHKTAGDGGRSKGAGDMAEQLAEDAEIAELEAALNIQEVVRPVSPPANAPPPGSPDYRDVLRPLDFDLRLRAILENENMDLFVDSEDVVPEEELTAYEPVENNVINIEPSATMQSSSSSRLRTATPSGGHDEEHDFLPRMTCIVCFQEDKCMLLEPCMHVCVCSNCSERLDKCPLCVARIARKRKVFI